MNDKRPEDYSTLPPRGLRFQVSHTRLGTRQYLYYAHRTVWYAQDCEALYTVAKPRLLPRPINVLYSVYGRTYFGVKWQILPQSRPSTEDTRKRKSDNTNNVNVYETANMPPSHHW